MVEAAGIEPLFPVNTNPMMVNDFGFCDMKNIELPCRFESPGVLSSPLESPQSWRYFGDGNDRTSAFAVIIWRCG